MIHIGLVAGPMFLTHDGINLFPPFAVELTETAVLVSVGVVSLVFLPKQGQGQVPVAAQFLVDVPEIREGCILSGSVCCRWEQQRLKRGVVQIIGQRPT